MKLALALVVAALVGLVGVMGLVAVNLQTLVDAHRAEIVERASRAIGRPLQVGGVSASFWPLGVRLQSLAIGDDPRFDAAPFVRAEGLLVAVRPTALLWGRLEASGLRLDAPVVTLRRARNGRWNVASLGDDESPRENDGAARPRRPRFRLPVEWVLGSAITEIRDGTLELVLEGASGPRRLLIRHVRVDAENVRLGGDAVVRVAAALDPESSGPDSRLVVRLPHLGETDAAHAPMTASVPEARVDLALLAAILGSDVPWTGRVATFTARFDGAVARFSAAVDLRTKGAVTAGGVEVVPAAGGALATRITRDGDRLQLTDGTGAFGAFAFTVGGSVDLEARRAELAVASVPGRSFALGPSDLEARDLDARVVVESSAILVPEGRIVAGGVAVAWSGGIRDLRTLAGDARFDTQDFGGPLDGTLVLAGRTRPLGVHVESGTLDLGLLAARMAPDLDGRLTGRIKGTLDLAVPLTDTPLDDVTGKGAVAVTHARVRDVNLAERVLDGIDDIPLMPRLVSARTRARYAELFAPRDTVVEDARFSFVLGDGRLASDDVRIQTGCYEVRGGGWVDADRQVRFRGDLVLGESLSATLREDLRLARYLCGADGRVTLPFRLRGPIDDPRPEPDMKRLRARGLQVLQDRVAPGDRDERGADGRERRNGGSPDAGAIVERLLDDLVRP